MSTITENGTHRIMEAVGEPSSRRRSVRPAGTGFRALGIGMILVVGGALIVGWASRHQRSSGSPSAAGPTSGEVEGGI